MQVPTIEQGLGMQIASLSVELQAWRYRAQTAEARLAELQAAKEPEQKPEDVLAELRSRQEINGEAH